MFVKLGIAAAALAFGVQSAGLEPPAEDRKLSSAEIMAYLDGSTLEGTTFVGDHCEVVANYGSFCVYSGPGCPLIAPCP